MISKAAKVVGSMIQQAVLVGTLVIVVAVMVRSAENPFPSADGTADLEHARSCAVCQTPFRLARALAGSD